MTGRKAILDHKVSAFDKASFAQTLTGRAIGQGMTLEVQQLGRPGATLPHIDAQQSELR
jgi:hypothetical protein